MKKTLMAALIATATFISPASADFIYSFSYGNWELKAWEGTVNRFCVVKTYFPGTEQTVSIRAASNGKSLVLYEPSQLFAPGPHNVNVMIDGVSMHGVGYSYGDSPNQIFIDIDESSSFLERFSSGRRMLITSPSFMLRYHLDLTGTRFLVNHLDNCVNRFGF